MGRRTLIFLLLGAVALVAGCVMPPYRISYYYAPPRPATQIGYCVYPYSYAPVYGYSYTDQYPYGQWDTPQVWTNQIMAGQVGQWDVYYQPQAFTNQIIGGQWYEPYGAWPGRGLYSGWHRGGWGINTYQPTWLNQAPRWSNQTPQGWQGQQFPGAWQQRLQGSTWSGQAPYSGSQRPAPFGGAQRRNWGH